MRITGLLSRTQYTVSLISTPSHFRVNLLVISVYLCLLLVISSVLLIFSAPCCYGSAGKRKGEDLVAETNIDLHTFFGKTMTDTRQLKHRCIYTGLQEANKVWVIKTQVRES